MTGDNIQKGLAFVYEGGGRVFHSERFVTSGVESAILRWRRGERIRSVHGACKNATVRTGLKGYDSKISRDSFAYMHGNVTSNFQFSSFVRAPSETQCNGFTNPPGHLTQFDLKPFRSHSAIGVWYQSFHDAKPDTPTICYLIRDRVTRSDAPTVRGFLVTDTENRLLVAQTHFHGNMASVARNASIMNEAMRFITHPDIQLGPLLMHFTDQEIVIHDTRLLASHAKEFEGVAIRIAQH